MIKVVNLSNTEDINSYNFGEQNIHYNKWVNFGKDNDYPEYLRSLYLSSPTHQAIIDGVVNMATGEGVEVVDPMQNPLSNKWLNENFPENTVKELISDLKMYGYCVVQVYGGSKIKYSDAIKYRFDSVKKDWIWYSNDWDNYTQKNNRPVKLPVYKEGSTEPISILYIQMDTKGYNYYSPVDYNGGINYISLEAEISKYHLSNIKNGLFPSFVITFIGNDFSDEQMKKIEYDINKKFGGSSNTGRAIIGFADTKDNATQLTTVDQPTLPDTYQFLTKECSEKILVAHGVTSPLLFGITRDTGNGLGSNSDEIKEGYYLFYESKLVYYQKYIIDLITKVMNGNLFYAPIQFKVYNPFSNRDTTQTLNKYEPITEINAQKILNKIDDIKVKPEGTFIREKLMIEPNTNGLYKYIKSSNHNNIVNKKFEILTKQGYLFKYDDIIKNTNDYYFMEQVYMKNNK